MPCMRLLARGLFATRLMRVLGDLQPLGAGYDEGA